MRLMQSSQMKMLPAALQKLMQNPSAVSAIASLGVHAILLTALPLFGSGLSDREPEIKTSVGLVELTAEEQNRLPDIADALPELPPIAQQPLPNQFQLPANPGGFSLNPLPFPPAPSGFNSFSDSSAPTVVFVPQPSFDFPPQPRRSVPPKPPAIQPSDPPENSADPRRPDNQAGQQPSTTDNQAFDPQPTQPANRPSLNDEIRARRDQLAAQTANQQDQLVADSSGVGDAAVSGNLGTWSAAAVKWLEGNEQKFKEINFKNPTQITADYPEAACPLQVNRSVLVGVLVDAEGKVTTQAENQPQVLGGSGYRIFNRKAIEDAIAHSFEATGEKEAYLMQLNYEYSKEACPAGSTAPQPAPQPGTQPAQG